jgi:hypothetical protein
MPNETVATAAGKHHTYVGLAVIMASLIAKSAPTGQGLYGCVGAALR